MVVISTGGIIACQDNDEVVGSEAWLPELKSVFLHPLYGCIWKYCFSFLGLHFFFCKMEIIIIAVIIIITPKGLQWVGPFLKFPELKKEHTKMSSSAMQDQSTYICSRYPSTLYLPHPNSQLPVLPEIINLYKKKKGLFGSQFGSSVHSQLTLLLWGLWHSKAKSHGGQE
jgi:hypothetical protein